MHIKSCQTLAGVVLSCLLSTTSNKLIADQPIAEQYLVSGRLAEGEAELLARLTKQPNSDQVRFELGILQFFRAIETVGQSFYEFGAQRSFMSGMVPFLRMPLPENPAPKAVALEDLRRVMEQLNRDLTKVDSTLAKIDSDDVKLSLHVFEIRLDFNSNGQIDESDKLGPVLLQYLGGRRGRRPVLSDFKDFQISFDRADAEWLRGYCCLLRAMSEAFLAYDQSLLWDTIAHRFFKRGIVQLDFLREEGTGKGVSFWDRNSMIDMIATIHNSRFPLKEPERLKNAHQYLLDTIGHSRKMWELINLEKDNDHEWIPSPDQDMPFSGVRLSREMTETWDKFLDESELILKGEKLIPFWRGTNKKRGVNLHKVFHQPTDVDVVLWAQGSGMVPFLEIGDCTSPRTWAEFQRVFRGNFFGFAVWFN